MRSWAALVAVLMISCSPPRPEVGFTPATPDDVRLLATEAFTDFLGAFPARSGCIGRVTLNSDRDQADRGRYEPQGAVITLRIPATAGKLRNSFIHELAHHLELACPAQADLRAAFQAAQGFPSTASWFEGPAWKDTPSEHFAEAVVEVVDGRRNLRYGIDVSQAAIDLVVGWGRG